MQSFTALISRTGVNDPVSYLIAVSPSGLPSGSQASCREYHDHASLVEALIGLTGSPEPVPGILRELASKRSVSLTNIYLSDEAASCFGLTDLNR
jgi:hypothetical protein